MIACQGTNLLLGDGMKLCKLPLIVGVALLAAGAAGFWLANREPAVSAAGPVPRLADPASRKTTRSGDVVGFADARETFGSP